MDIVKHYQLKTMIELRTPISLTKKRTLRGEMIRQYIANTNKLTDLIVDTIYKNKHLEKFLIFRKIKRLAREHTTPLMGCIVSFSCLIFSTPYWQGFTLTNYPLKPPDRLP